MPLPNINISFSTAASTAIERSKKGIVALIIRDAAENGAHVLNTKSQIPSALGTANKSYVERAFRGYVSPPRKVIVYVQPADSTALTEGLAYLATQTFDYLAGPPDISASECAAVAAWIAAQREGGFTPKAVLPDTEADSEAIVNFTTSGIMSGFVEYSAAQYCSRVAGLIAGTPMTISCTYAPLTEVSDIDRLTKDEMDAAVDAGEFILFYDGEKVKVGRGVNSFQTTTDAKGAAFKKIKIVEAIDMIRSDIQMTAQDSYIGRYANSYDNKCLLVSAIKTYLNELESDGILKSGASAVGIDVDAQEDYLRDEGTDTSDMTEQEIREANTGDEVFLKATVSILDAIEDITLDITI